MIACDQNCLTDKSEPHTTAYASVRKSIPLGGESLPFPLLNQRSESLTNYAEVGVLVKLVLFMGHNHPYPYLKRSTKKMLPKNVIPL
jgi:hypothetical protein